MEKENVQDWGITYRITFTNLPCVLIYEIKESSDGSQDQFLAPERQNYKFKSRKKISRGIKRKRQYYADTTLLYNVRRIENREMFGQPINFCLICLPHYGEMVC